ncbi:hypothetical protein [Mucilaginibacter sp. UYCu711]|uniref:hypothetical protein n=1 Tax=Mucilaginibacter sp. UYCu711 TaxID=3156339 RepID=UPI003D23E99C
MTSVRWIFLFFAINCLWLSICYGQSPKDIIENVKKSFSEINNDKLLQSVKLDNTSVIGQMTDGGNSLTGYFNGSTIRKIKVWVGLSFGIRQYEYYLKDNQVFFIYEREEDFRYDNKTGQILYTHPKLGFEGRYYLNEGKIIDVKINGKKRFGEKPIISSLKDIKVNVKRYTKALQADL